MEIKGMVHCYFEQSGAFKKAFRELGIHAEDYDIQDEFGETDHIIDLFAEIERCYVGGESIISSISADDLIIAFFPCVYFTGATNPCYFRLDNRNYCSLSLRDRFAAVLERSSMRERYYRLLYMLVCDCMEHGIRLIVENPYSTNHYLHNNFLKAPDLVDSNRHLRGDIFRKPTGYWFFGCRPTHLRTYQPALELKRVFACRPAPHGGICSTERSMISPDYARNFICDNILGIEQPEINRQPILPNWEAIIDAED